MYDFYYGKKDKIIKNQEDFLISCKRLLPRWVNSIPDSEFLAIYRILKKIKSKKPILIETGCGASTLAMFLYCALNNGKMFSWDTNGSKGSFLRTIILESICRPLNMNIFDIWTFIGFDSTSQHVGIPILTEFGKRADFGFFDSWHTLDHLMKEIECFEGVVKDYFVIAIDDAYYTNKNENISYLNMIRKKLNLAPVQDPINNKCKPFYIEIEKYLTNKYSNVTNIVDTHKTEYSKDVYFDYYKNDRKALEDFGMEIKDQLDHRFDSWAIRKTT